MKVLVSTTEGQGGRKSDFTFTDEGELVYFGFECDCDRNNIDGGCGCRRSMCGMSSGVATTTFKVIERDITEKDYLVTLHKRMMDAGWGPTLEESEEMADELMKIAKDMPSGVVLEKRGNQIQERLDS